MPSFQDSAVIFLLALLLFGPKKLPELARYIGKLMGEFRKASSEFRMQMDDEFRVIEQAEQTRKIAAIEAAAPVTPLNIPEPEHPHLPTPTVADSSPSIDVESDPSSRPDDKTLEQTSSSRPEEQTASPSDPQWRACPEPVEGDPRIASSSEAAQPQTPIPIASNGDLHLMPPATGLPISRANHSTSLSPVFDAIPHLPEPEAPTHG